MLARLDERDRRPLATCAPRPPDPVDVEVGRRGDVEVDDVGDVLDVEPAGGHVRGHQHVERAVAEPAHHPVALLLGEAAVERRRVVAAPAQRLRQVVHLAPGPGKDEGSRRILDVEDPAQRGELVGAPDDVDELAHLRRLLVGRSLGTHGDADRLAKVARRDTRDRGRDRGREERCLARGGRGRQDRIEVLREAHVEHLVGLVEDDGLHRVQAKAAAREVVDGTSRGRDDDVEPAPEPAQLLPDRLAAVHGEDACAEAAPVAVDGLGDLHRQLPGRHQHQREGGPLGSPAEATRPPGAAGSGGRMRPSCRCRSAPPPAGRDRQAGAGSPPPGRASAPRSRGRRASRAAPPRDRARRRSWGWDPPSGQRTPRRGEGVAGARRCCGAPNATNAVGLRYHRRAPRPRAAGYRRRRCVRGGLRRGGVHGGPRDPVLRALWAGHGHARQRPGRLPQLPVLRSGLLRRLLEPGRRRLPRLRSLPPRRQARPIARDAGPRARRGTRPGRRGRRRRRRPAGRGGDRTAGGNRAGTRVVRARARSWPWARCRPRRRTRGAPSSPRRRRRPRAAATRRAGRLGLAASGRLGRRGGSRSRRAGGLARRRDAGSRRDRDTRTTQPDSHADARSAHGDATGHARDPAAATCAGARPTPAGPAGHAPACAAGDRRTSAAPRRVTVGRRRRRAQRDRPDAGEPGETAADRRAPRPPPAPPSRPGPQMTPRAGAGAARSPRSPAAPRAGACTTGTSGVRRR